MCRCDDCHTVIDKFRHPTDIQNRRSVWWRHHSGGRRSDAGLALELPREPDASAGGSQVGKPGSGPPETEDGAPERGAGT